jgi:hypothetical protein
VKPVKGATPEILFPKFNYYLDESDPDIVILRGQDDSFVAAFSARGVTRKASSRPRRKPIGDYSFGIIEPGKVRLRSA